MDGRKILYKGGEGEIVEKKSRFIATLRPIASEEEAAQFLAEIRKKGLFLLDYRYNMIV